MCGLSRSVLHPPSASPLSLQNCHLNVFFLPLLPASLPQQTDRQTFFSRGTTFLTSLPCEGCPTTGGASGCPKCFIQSGRNAANPPDAHIGGGRALAAPPTPPPSLTLTLLPSSNPFPTARAIHPPPQTQKSPFIQPGCAEGKKTAFQNLLGLRFRIFGLDFGGF